MGKLTEKVQESEQNKIARSIMDMRRIYPEKTDEKFALWYNKKYKVPVPAIMRVLDVYNEQNPKN